MPPTASRRSPAWLCLLALLVWGGLSSCTATVANKRILQYLNQSGFGKRYHGNAQEQNYVSIGDTVAFADTYNPEVKGTERVDIDGTIFIDQLGSVAVAGLTRTELESFLTQKLAPYYTETDVKVQIRTGGDKVLFAMGQVGRRGPIKYTGDMTIFEAVLLAGPDKHGANLGRVKLIRPDPKDPLILVVDVTQLWRSGDSTYNVQVQEYDILYVPPTFLQSIADLISGIFVPATSVLREVLFTLLAIDDPRFFTLNRRGRLR